MVFAGGDFRQGGAITSATVNAGISVGSSTSVLILAANSSRKRFFISSTVEDILMKLQTAATDNTTKGILIPQDYTFDSEEEKGECYTGEVSAISITGTATVYGTEY